MMVQTVRTYIGRELLLSEADITGADLGGGGGGVAPGARAAPPPLSGRPLNIQECILRIACDYNRTKQLVPRLATARIHVHHVHVHGKGQL